MLTVTRDNGLCARPLRKLENSILIDVRRLIRSGKQVSLVGEPDVQARPIRRRIDGYTRQTELSARLDDPTGDLAAVSDEDLMDMSETIWDEKVGRHDRGVQGPGRPPRTDPKAVDIDVDSRCV